MLKLRVRMNVIAYAAMRVYFHFTNLAEPDDQPTSSDGLDHNNENCAVVQPYKIFRDTSCASSFGAVCQYSTFIFQLFFPIIGANINIELINPLSTLRP